MSNGRDAEIGQALLSETKLSECNVTIDKTTSVHDLDDHDTHALCCSVFLLS